jgi:transcriptional regulator
MYTPSSFRQEDVAVLREMMTRIGFVSLVTNTATGLLATHAPVLFDTNNGEQGTLRGHIARANPQWQTATEDESLAIFVGPNGYVSPQWYAAKQEHGRVVPTWNYVAVHAYGKVRFSDDRDLLLEIVTRLTEKNEVGFDQPWKVSDAPSDYVEGMLKAIVAFEMPITRIEASWKLSQNRSEADRTGTLEGLRSQGSAVAEEMCKVMHSPKQEEE